MYTWYCILTQKGKAFNERWILAEAGFDADEYIPKDKCLGSIELYNNNDWLCYTSLHGQDVYCGFDSARLNAKARVADEIKRQVRSYMVLVDKISGEEGPSVQGIGAGLDELATDRIRG